MKKKGRRHDPTQCEHPNEVPRICPCKSGCWCHHGRSCDPRGSARRSPTAGNRGRGSDWIKRSLRHQIYDRDGRRCVWCDSDGPLTLDHFIPRSQGGSDIPGNLLTACKKCNAKRGNLPADAWVRRTQSSIETRAGVAWWVLKRLCAPLPPPRKKVFVPILDASGALSKEFQGLANELL